MNEREEMDLTKQYLELIFSKIETLKQDIQTAYQHLANLHNLLENPIQEEILEPGKQNILSKIIPQKKEKKIEEETVLENAEPPKNWKESEEEKTKKLEQLM